MQKESKYTMKSYDELFFTDDFLFSKIMRNPKIAKGVVQNLLGIKVKKIEFVTSQYSIDELYNGKGIRLDAYLEDEDKIIDIEMQTVIKKDEGLRMRYYQSMMDIDHLNRGESFKNLKEFYVVFICLDDPFGDAKPVYNFATKELDGSRILNDRIHKVIYNASSFEKADDRNVHAFLQFLKNRTATDSLTKEIQSAVNSCKNHQRWRAEYMLWKDQIREWKDEAREDGIKENTIETAKKMLENELSADLIVKCTGLSLEEVNKLKENH